MVKSTIKRWLDRWLGIAIWTGHVMTVIDAPTGTLFMTELSDRLCTW